MTGRAIGIDLGTTYSVVAALDERGEAQALTDVEGNVLIPSAVHFVRRGEAVVGRLAKASQAVEPDRVVTAVKRDMGTELTRRFDEVDLTPEGISGVILRALAVTAANALGVAPESLRAVITVPAYFGVAEKEATAQAAAIAGLDLMELVAEPVAAAVSYGVDSGTSGLVLVYDLGGGTFDTTVLEVGAEGPRVLVTDGSSRLGGLNWDDRLQSLLLERFVAVTQDEDALDDDDFQLAVAAAAEDLKKQLSERESASVTLTRGRERSRIALSRSDFEERTADLVAMTLEVVQRALSLAGTRCRLPLREVILVGGSTKMPMIAAALREAVNVPVALRDPDLAVAKGAALHAAALDRRAGVPPEQPLIAVSAKGERARSLQPATGVVPRAIGVLLRDSHDPSGTRLFVEHLVTANTPLPVVGVEATFATIMKNQDRVRVELFEQAGPMPSPDLANNRRVLDGELIGLPQLPAGSPIELTLAVAPDGRIRCTALEPRSGKVLVLESYMEGVVDGAAAAAQRHHVSSLRISS
ncbi:MAG: Hsp70 family protein [Kineosporiaceae bacterium]|nr:Hsp70 family protein [Kineosporiaceae bacterium]MBK7624172.1 Hsp70 family protein [Kineosporiaceae bacterium]MBK8075354.1 Hsp70 family protein [Kineosporiaceae bacterium]